MTAKRILKRIHLVATVWLILCIGYLLASSLRQAGLQWWLVFSLSGYSTAVIFLVVSLYLFAFFRGAGRGSYVEIEHPLTSAGCYVAFYVLAPLLGGLLAAMQTAGTLETGRFLFSIARDTLATTFVVWIVVDPLLGAAEALLPASRKHRAEREHGAIACLGTHQ
jgi:hypothetical protein